MSVAQDFSYHLGHSAVRRLLRQIANPIILSFLQSDLNARNNCVFLGAAIRTRHRAQIAIIPPMLGSKRGG